MQHIDFDEKQGYIGRVPFGADLYQFFSDFVKEKNIKAGQITAFGAVSKATVAFYDQHKNEYIERHFPKHMEILNVTGNVSILEDQPFVHLHILLSDEEGSAYGGHLVKGTEVFACEFIVKEFSPSQELIRVKDDTTALSLWDI